MEKIVPCLWFNMNAEEAVNFYVSVFKNAKIGKISYYVETGNEHHRGMAGKILTIEFELNGQTFTALNGGPYFKFNEAVSLQIMCENQAEIDYYWEKLSEGGDKAAQQCGWLKDKFGLSWQVAPKILRDMIQDKDTRKTQRVMTALLQMKKIDLKALLQAYEQK